MSNKGVLVLLLLLSLALSGCGKQRSNNSTLRSNEEIDFPEIYTEFNESYNGEVKKMDGFEGQTYYSYGLWGENSQYMLQPSIWKIIRCILFWFLQITWENSSTVL